nr:hypothetical protein [Tanacetum cinerariifolium]
MDTTIEQQAAMDEALVPHAQRYMLHICPRVHGQSFAEPPFEEEILSFIHFLGHSAALRTLTDVNIKKLYQPWRSFAAIINKCLTRKSYGYDSLRLSQAQILDDHMFSTIKLVSRHQNTQQFGALLPIELTNEEIRNSNAYKEYYAIATGVAPPKPKASATRTRSSSDTFITPPTVAASPRLTASANGKQTAKASKAKIATGATPSKPKASVRKTRSSSDTTVTPPTTTAGPRLTTSAKGKQPATTSKAKSLYALSEVAMIEAQQLKLATKRSLQQTHISQASGSGANEGTSSIPGVLDVPTDESEEEIYWNSTNEEGDDNDDDDEGDDGDDGEEGNDDDDDEQDEMKSSHIR